MINGMPVQPPDLQTTLRKVREDIFKTLHVCKPGIIKAYDSFKRTATIQLHFKRQLYNGKVMSFPVLVDCPVFTPQGGKVHASFPIANGDNCLVFFADSNIDAWYGNGKQPAVPFDGRHHDLSDGFALVGINSLSTPLATPLAPGEGGLADDKARVAIKDGKATLQNDTLSLLTILQDLIDGINGLKVGGVAVTDTTGKVAQSSVDLGGLLY